MDYVVWNFHLPYRVVVLESNHSSKEALTLKRYVEGRTDSRVSDIRNPTGFVD